MKKSPIYHKKNQAYRVVYRMPNHWVAQRNTGEPSTREFDPWQDLHKPVETMVEAHRIMIERGGAEA